MNISRNIKDKIQNDGFVVIEDIVTEEEIDDLTQTISQVDTSRPTFRKTSNLFAVSQFLREVSMAVDVLFNNRLTTLISATFGDKFFGVKSIYFDKPEGSNWFVTYHQYQYLTISVDKKLTSKASAYGRQSKISLLYNHH